MHKKLWKKALCGCMAVLLAVGVLPFSPLLIVQAANSSTVNSVEALSVDLSKRQGEVTHDDNN